MKVKVVLPIISSIFNEEVNKEFEFYASADTEISVENLDFGPASIESQYDEALAVPNFLEKAIAAEKEGYDAVICNCFGDSGVRPAREIIDIPVIGPGEAAMLLATSLAHTYSIVTVLPNVVPMIKDLSKLTGLDEKLASVRYVCIPVLEVNDKERLLQGLFEQSLQAIKEDGAHSIILGCTGFLGMATDLQEKLLQNGYDVPVLDPAFAAIKLVETFVAMNLKQSRLTYMSPPSKERNLSMVIQKGD